ncbi:hypothetical protein D187_010147 [Cystobacter fuscus DSM 2262]|uniref:Uncharacterized protein n=1 Tax=Cystobacter fuscus (strain ATCC 25194 / DSM 2262 / NBRC 100088 / M29) TaxID=1242864 RepID=S9QXZ1_CYSF2|nr:hypothetical protein D187_010147 [Cystobacter fuscus DSM 2262]
MRAVRLWRTGCRWADEEDLLRRVGLALPRAQGLPTADRRGVEKSLGAKTRGEACTYTPADSEAQLASTDCAPGYACSGVYDGGRQCLATCDFMAADPGCPTGTVCGVYGVCIQQSVMEPIGDLFDSARIGEACTASYAEFCGVEGARGVCVDLNRSGYGTCYRYARARSECGASEELGFISYPLANGGFDRTYGWLSRRGQARTCRRQSQVLQKRSHPCGLLHVCQDPPPASTPHADEHVEVERPPEQPRPVHSRPPLLQRLLAGRCMGRHARLLLSCVGEQKWPHLRAWSEDAVEPREVCPRRRHQGRHTSPEARPSSFLAQWLAGGAERNARR